jgi:hypothetical protein
MYRALSIAQNAALTVITLVTVALMFGLVSPQLTRVWIVAGAAVWGLAQCVLWYRSRKTPPVTIITAEEFSSEVRFLERNLERQDQILDAVRTDVEDLNASVAELSRLVAEYRSRRVGA